MFLARAWSSLGQEEPLEAWLQPVARRARRKSPSWRGISRQPREPQNLLDRWGESASQQMLRCATWLLNPLPLEWRARVK